MTAFQLDAGDIAESENGEEETASHASSRPSEASGSGSGPAASASDTRSNPRRSSGHGSVDDHHTTHSGSALQAAGGRPALVSRPAARYESLL